MDEAVNQLQAEYDAVPYESHAFPQSAPRQLAAVAHLFSLPEEFEPRSARFRLRG